MTVSKILSAKKIKDFRDERQISQLEFGKRMGVTPQAVYKWEKELSYPDISLLPALAELLDCQIKDFFYT